MRNLPTVKFYDYRGKISYCGICTSCESWQIHQDSGHLNEHCHKFCDNLKGGYFIKPISKKVYPDLKTAQKAIKDYHGIKRLTPFHIIKKQHTGSFY